MRVLAVTPTYPRFPGDYHGGFVRDLCWELHSRSVDVTVLAPRSRTMAPTPSPFPVKRFPYLPSRRWETVAEETLKGAPAGTLLRLPAYLASGAAHVQASEADVIHSHLAIPLGWAASYTLPGVPKVVTCHGSDCSLPLENPVLRPFAARALKTADAVVAVSDHVGRMAERLGARSPATIYSGVDTGRFRPRPRLGTRRGSRVIVGTLGRLVPQKNVDRVIDAVALLKGRLNARLLVAGGGPDRVRLEERSRRAGVDAAFLGATAEPELFYPRLDAFVLASTSEGLSTALREAMASGCACVAVRGSGSEEAVTDGVDGFLCDPDPSGIADAVKKAVDVRGVGREARRTVTERFSLRRSAEEHVRLYERLAA